MITFLKKLLPNSMKAKIRNLALDIVGPGGSDQELFKHQDTIAQLLDQKITATEQRLSTNQDNMTQILDQKIEQSIANNQARFKMLTTQTDRKIMALAEKAKIQGTLTPPKIDYLAFEEKYHVSRISDAYFRIGLEEAQFQGKSVIDLGFGRGELMSYLANLGANVTGVDSNESYVSHVRELGLDAHLNDALSFLQSKEDNSADYIFLLHVVEHLELDYLLLLLTETNRVLGKEGKLVLETPKIASLNTLSNHYFSDPTHLMPRHHNLYIECLLSRGFSEQNVNDVIETSSKHVLKFEEMEKKLVASNEDWLEEIKFNFDSLEQSIYVPRDIRLVFTK